MHLVIPLSIDRSYRYEYSSGLLIIRHAKLADKLTTICMDHMHNSNEDRSRL